MKKLTVVIVSYNVEDYVCQCLLSLRRALRDIDAEVCVVDNHSSDGTVDFLRKNFPEIKVVASP
ncbi:MAG: glycosyltransferase, partial [Prevotella sp.]|nr:glycosyltransferase [Prevotella sp.]